MGGGGAGRARNRSGVAGEGRVRGCGLVERPPGSAKGDGRLSPTLRLPRGHPRGGDGVVPCEPGAARVVGALKGLAILVHARLGARHRPRRDPVGRTSARRNGVVGVAWGGVGVVKLKPDLRWGVADASRMVLSRRRLGESPPGKNTRAG